MNIGDRVVIEFNPYEPHADGVEGRIVNIRPGAAWNGVDMIDVRYYSPTEAREIIMPYGMTNLRKEE